MKIIAFSICAALASFAGPALADEGLTQGPANVSEMQCSALTGSARLDCEQRVMGPDDGNQFSEKQFGRPGAAGSSGADGSIESAQDNQNRSSRQASRSAARGTDGADAAARDADNCPRD